MWTRAKIENPNKAQAKLILGVQFAMIFMAFVSNIFAVRAIQFWGLTETGALILFAICYSAQDILGEFCSLKSIVKIVLLTYAIQIAVFGFAAIVGLFPVVEGNEEITTAFHMVLGATPRIVLASFLAYLAGSLTNAFILKIIPDTKIKFKGRAMLSTVVGEFFDTWVFLAVAGIILDWENAVKVTLCKVAMEALILPLTAYIKRRIESAT